MVALIALGGDEHKAEVVLAGPRGDRSVRDVCREYEISETLYYSWRDKLLEGGKAALANPTTRTPEHAEIVELKRRSRPWNARWGARPTSWRSRGNSRGIRADPVAAETAGVQIWTPADLPVGRRS